MIPIRNLYFILCYAWDRRDEGALVSIPGDDAALPQDLLASILLTGARRVLRDGLDRGYFSDYEETTSLRGRLDCERTVARLLLQQGKAGVHLDELTHNVLHNRILKSTMVRMAAIDSLEASIAQGLRGAVRRFDDVTTIPLSPALFQRVQLYANNRFYRFLMNVCELAYSLMLPGEGEGQYRFRDLLRDEVRMRAIFQEFVFNFFRIEQNAFTVRSERLRWNGIAFDEESKELWPGMETDVTLESPQRKIVVDTKYYPEAFVENRFGKKKVHSSHLFQIFAYVMNTSMPLGGRRVEGCLLYPATSEDFDLRYELHGHPIRVVSVDLREPWAKIAGRLKGLLAESPISSTSPSPPPSTWGTHSPIPA